VAKRLTALFATMLQYKKESLVPSADKAPRRLNLVELGKVTAGSHLVFAPLPNAKPTLQEAIDILAQLRASNGQKCVLFLSDWSARVCSACNADIKAIGAYYTILIASLKAVDSAVMENVQILMQSEAILADPSNYWISEGALRVQRSAENGGDQVFQAPSELEKEFADGTLHPGDLKAASTDLMFGVLEKLAAGIKADAEATKAAKTIKAFQKKMAKSQK
jgi:hypothetical protein